MIDWWPARNASFMRTGLCVELWSGPGEGERHRVTSGRNACFHVEAVIEIEGVKVGPKRSHIALQNLRLERSNSRKGSSASESRVSSGDGSNFGLALVFEKPGQFTLPLQDITRIRCKHLQQGKASIEAKGSLVLLSASSQEDLERLLHFIRDVKTGRTITDARSCSVCKEKGHEQKNNVRQKWEQQQPSDSVQTCKLDGDCQVSKKQKVKVLECMFRKKQLSNLTNSGREQLQNELKNVKSWARDQGAQKVRKLAMSRDGAEERPIDLDIDDVYDDTAKIDIDTSCDYPLQNSHKGREGPTSPSRVILLEEWKRRGLADASKRREKKRSAIERRRESVCTRSIDGEKENVAVMMDADVSTTVEAKGKRFSDEKRFGVEEQREMQEELKRVADYRRQKEEQRIFQEEEWRRPEENERMMRRAEEQRIFQEEEWRQKEENERMMRRAEDLRKLVEIEKKRMIEWEAKQQEEKHKWKGMEERKQKAEEERQQKFLERKQQEEEKKRRMERKQQEEEEKRRMEEERKQKEEEERQRRQKLLERKLQQEVRRRKDEEEKRLQEFKQREEKRLLELAQKLEDQMQEEKRIQYEEKKKRMQDEENKKRMQDEEIKKQDALKNLKLQEDQLRDRKRKQEELRKFHEEVRHSIHERKRSTEEGMRLDEERKLQEEVRRKLLLKQRERLEERTLDEDMKRWQDDESRRRAKEDRWTMPEHDRVRLAEQRKRVENVMKMSRDLARKRIEETLKNNQDKKQASEVTTDENGGQNFFTDGNRALDEDMRKFADKQNNLLNLEEVFIKLKERCRSRNETSERETPILDPTDELSYLHTRLEQQKKTSREEDKSRMEQASDVISDAAAEFAAKLAKSRQEVLKKEDQEQRRAEKAAFALKKKLLQEQLRAAKAEAKRLQKERKEAEKRAKAEERQKAQERTKQRANANSTSRPLWPPGIRILQHLTYQQYEDSWNLFKVIGKGSPLRYSDIPWPPHGNPLFVEVGDSVASQRRKLRIALLRWHPDKFVSLCGNRLSSTERDSIEAHARNVAQEVIQWKCKLDTIL